MKFSDLSSDRVILKEIGMYGLKDMYEYSKIESFYKFLEFPPQKSINHTEEYLNKLLRRHKRDNEFSRATRNINYPTLTPFNHTF